jgi:hypothetical protein
MKYDLLDFTGKNDTQEGKLPDDLIFKQGVEFNRGIANIAAEQSFAGKACGNCDVICIITVRQVAHVHQDL